MLIQVQNDVMNTIVEFQDRGEFKKSMNASFIVTMPDGRELRALMIPCFFVMQLRPNWIRTSSHLVSGSVRS
ncbi:hypothetical protein H5410_019130 [Solanum commersonii]|uniref:Uncharacterized protein n=1 Tax=Solanum commersonii TaxID=4109 RepID=A0A9J6A4N0_SOLCO|nr:hypothetical protein H5410_019130 [Solanum commersonii]